MRRISIGQIVNLAVLILIALTTLYPFLYVLALSLSSPHAITTNRVWLWPVEITFKSFWLVFQNAKIITGFRNSIVYTVSGTVISVFFTMTTAYPLAEPSFRKYSRFFMLLIIFTMFFGGGLIPGYILVKNLHMIDTIWAIIIPGAVSAFNLILAKTYVESLPSDLSEAALIDGANELKIFWWIIFPLCKPIIAVITLYYAVGLWNSYFGPLLFLNTQSKYTLQIFLQQIVMQSSMSTEQSVRQEMTKLTITPQSIQSAALVVSTIPILIVYPFLQKYFVSGIMLGAVKG